MDGFSLQFVNVPCNLYSTLPNAANATLSLDRHNQKRPQDLAICSYTVDSRVVAQNSNHIHHTVGVELYAIP